MSVFRTVISASTKTAFCIDNLYADHLSLPCGPEFITYPKNFGAPSCAAHCMRTGKSWQDFSAWRSGTYPPLRRSDTISHDSVDSHVGVQRKTLFTLRNFAVENSTKLLIDSAATIDCRAVRDTSYSPVVSPVGWLSKHP
jgi:hypothetical protein